MTLEPGGREGVGGISLSHTHKHTETQRREHRVKPNECMNCVHGSSEGEMGKERKENGGGNMCCPAHTPAAILHHFSTDLQSQYFLQEGEAA